MQSPRASQRLRLARYRSPLRLHSLADDRGSIDPLFIRTLMFILLLVVIALGIVFSLGFSLFLKAIFAVAIIALVPEVIDLLLAHYSASEDAARTTPPNGEPGKGDKTKADGLGSRSMQGLTRGTIAVAVLVIFGVALFRLLQIQCPGVPIPATSVTTFAESPSPPGSETGTPETSPSTSPSSGIPSAIESTQAPIAGVVSASCADNGQLLSTMLGAIIALLAAISSFYFATRATETASAAAAATTTQDKKGDTDTQRGDKKDDGGGPTPVKPEAPPSVALEEPLREGEGVRLRGKVTPGGSAAMYRFEVGEEKSRYDPAGFTPDHLIASGVPEQPVVSDRVYHGKLHYRLIAWTFGKSLISATEDREWPPGSRLSGPGAVELIAIHQEGGDGHEHIASVRWLKPELKETGYSTVEELIDWLNNTPGSSAYVSDATHRAAVLVVHADPPHIRTEPDEFETTDLLGLPRY